MGLVLTVRFCGFLIFLHREFFDLTSEKKLSFLGIDYDIKEGWFLMSLKQSRSSNPFVARKI